jgi:hypothetical protein
MSEHALLQPSAAHRWLHCPGSVYPNAQPRKQVRVDKRNLPAEEGTAAHALFEMCLRVDHPPEQFEGAELPFQHVVNEGMIEAVGHAFDYVRNLTTKHVPHELHIESWIDVGKAIDVPATTLSGTPDAAVHATKARRLWTIDYKHGIGVPVDVTRNPQLMLYSAGILERAGWPKTDIIHTVIQPRAPGRAPIAEEHMKSTELREWMNDEVKPKVIRIYGSTTGTQPDPLAPRHGGAWCKWCAAEGTCKEYADIATRAAMRDFTPVYQPGDHNLHALDMTTEELAQALNSADLLEQWLHSVRAFALQLALDGTAIPGWEAGYTVPRRIWGDAEKVRALMERLRLPLDEYMPRELLSPAQTEKLLKRHKVKEPEKLVAPLVTRGIPERKLVKKPTP